VSLAVVYINASPSLTRKWQLNRAAKELRIALDSDVRYSNVRIFVITKDHGYLECTGSVQNTNTYNMLLQVFEKYSSTCPIHNGVFISPSDTPRK
jgi:hypothetical protein